MVDSNTIPAETGFTDRYLVLLDKNQLNDGIELLRGMTSSNTVATSDELEQNPDSANNSDMVVLEALGLVIVNHLINEEEFQSVTTAVSDNTNPILSIEREQYFYALSDVRLDEDYQLSQVTVASPTSTSTTAWNQSLNAWGLQATKVSSSTYTGRGIKIAILDTGFDFSHPDFVGRSVQSQSFVLKRNPASGKYEPIPVDDVDGHGTHCVGVACGPKVTSTLPRYGVAYEADIYVGKVLNDVGRGITGEIAAGINWAIKQGCHIISMSLGSPKKPGTSFLVTYENIAKNALQAGSLIVAAAGNSRKDSLGRNVVNSPADCPSVMAVAALDEKMQVASFSSTSDTSEPGKVDIAAPGVGIYSSYPMSKGVLPRGYFKMNGTSMATPYVAGIAALYAQATGKRGQDLWDELVKTANVLPLPPADVGAGLATAP